MIVGPDLYKRDAGAPTGAEWDRLDVLRPIRHACTRNNPRLLAEFQRKLIAQGVEISWPKIGPR